MIIQQGHNKLYFHIKKILLRSKTISSIDSTSNPDVKESYLTPKALNLMGKILQVPGVISTEFSVYKIEVELSMAFDSETVQEQIQEAIEEEYPDERL